MNEKPISLRARLGSVDLGKGIDAAVGEAAKQGSGELRGWIVARHRGALGVGLTVLFASAGVIAEYIKATPAVVPMVLSGAFVAWLLIAVRRDKQQRVIAARALPASDKPAPEANPEIIGPSARVLRSDVLMRQDWTYPTEIEIELEPTASPVDVSAFRLEWRDGVTYFSDEGLARYAQEPIAQPPHFLLERPLTRRLAFLVPQRWHDQGFGRIVVKAGTEDVPSDWFPMLAPKR